MIRLVIYCPWLFPLSQVLLPSPFLVYKIEEVLIRCLVSRHDNGENHYNNNSILIVDTINKPVRFVMPGYEASDVYCAVAIRPHFVARPPG